MKCSHIYGNYCTVHNSTHIDSTDFCGSFLCSKNFIWLLIHGLMIVLMMSMDNFVRQKLQGYPKVKHKQHLSEEDHFRFFLLQIIVNIHPRHHVEGGGPSYNPTLTALGHYHFHHEHDHVIVIIVIVIIIMRPLSSFRLLLHRQPWASLMADA